MFSYYGSKSRIINIYPEPICDKIIEPFAGSGRFALKYWDREVLLVDKYKVVCDVWNWLKQCSYQDIVSQPRFKISDTINRKDLDCDAQFEFLRMLLQQGSTGGIKVYPWGLKAYEKNLERIAGNLFKIRHWDIINGCYSDIGNQNATWFIDPPYQVGGYRYKENNRSINYEALSGWCSERIGQVIVCENTSANWLDFKPLKNQKGISNNQTTEAIFTCQNYTVIPTNN